MCKDHTKQLVAWVYKAVKNIISHVYDSMSRFFYVNRAQTISKCHGQEDDKYDKK